MRKKPVISSTELVECSAFTRSCTSMIELLFNMLFVKLVYMLHKMYIAVLTFHLY